MTTEAPQAKTETAEEPKQLSKSALKRQAKQAQRKAYWREERKKRKEERRRAREEEEEGEEEGAEQQPKKRCTSGEAAAAGAAATSAEARPKRAVKKGWKAIAEKGLRPTATVCIDLSFGDAMTDKECRALANQLCFAYGANGRACDAVAGTGAFLEIVATSFQGRIAETIDRQQRCRAAWQWVRWEPAHFVDAFAAQRERLVYLTAEAATPMETLDPEKIYIIGGLVDHNRLKGACHAEAERLGVATMRLPLAEHVEMHSRKVLTVNHVFEILLALAWNGGDWAGAFAKVLPARKGAHIKSHGDDDDDGTTSSSDCDN